MTELVTLPEANKTQLPNSQLSAEQASLVDHDDPIWKDYWEELPEYNDEVVLRISQNESRLDKLRKQIRMSDCCSDEETSIIRLFIQTI